MQPGIIVPIALFSAVFGAFYVFVMTRHREKMYMMEHELNRDEYAPRFLSGLYQTLKAGILMVGLAIGLFVAYQVDENYRVDSEVVYPLCLLLFGGLALIIQFFIEKKAKS